MTPVITYGIIGITVLVSLVGFNNRSLLERLMLNPYQVKYDKEYYRLFSHGLIHAGTVHLFFNMFVFWSFGQALEIELIKRYDVNFGRLLFAGLYVGSVLFASIPAMRNHINNPSYNSLGASGAVSAVLIATLILFPLSEISLLFIPIPFKAYIGIILFFGVEYYMNKRGKSFIAHDAHIYGAYFGILFLLVLDYHNLSEFFHKVQNHISSLIS